MLEMGRRIGGGCGGHQPGSRAGGLSRGEPWVQALEMEAVASSWRTLKARFRRLYSARIPCRS